jgi:hypothetical protein
MGACIGAWGAGVGGQKAPLRCACMPPPTSALPAGGALFFCAAALARLHGGCQYPAKMSPSRSSNIRGNRSPSLSVQDMVITFHILIKAGL